MSKITDNTLVSGHTGLHSNVVENCRKGDPRAQYELYNLYAKAMYNVCLRMMKSKEEAEDMLQEAFSEAFHRISSFRFESAFGAWLKRIVVNRCINEINRRKTDLEYFDDMVNFENEKETDDDKYETELTVKNIRNAMNRLPEGSRLIFSLYMLEGYDHVEISEILHISESNSKSQFLRAKRRIKEILTQMNERNDER